MRGRVLLCMLAYSVEWHMRRLAPLLFQQGGPTAARARRDTPVEPARVSDHAQLKTAIRVTTRPAKLRSKAFERPGVDPHQTVPITVTGCESRLDCRSLINATGCEMAKIRARREAPVKGPGDRQMCRVGRGTCSGNAAPPTLCSIWRRWPTHCSDRIIAACRAGTQEGGSLAEAVSASGRCPVQRLGRMQGPPDGRRRRMQLKSKG